MAQCHNTNNGVATACKLSSIVDLKQLYIEDGSSVIIQTMKWLAACKLNSIVDLKQLYIEDGSVS